MSCSGIRGARDVLRDIEGRDGGPDPDADMMGGEEGGRGGEKVAQRIIAVGLYNTRMGRELAAVPASVRARSVYLFIDR